MSSMHVRATGETVEVCNLNPTLIESNYFVR